MDQQNRRWSGYRISSRNINGKEGGRGGKEGGGKTMYIITPRTNKNDFETNVVAFRT